MHDADSPLVHQAQQGDSHAFASLYRKYVAPIYRFCYWQTNKSHDAEDLTQNVFVEMAKSLKTFRNKSSFKNWLYVIAKRQVANWISHKYKLPQVQLTEVIPDTPELIDPDNVRLKRTLVQKLLQKLTPKERQILEFRYLSQHSIQDTASKFKLSVSNIKVLCHRALRKLQRETL